jgi:hypothetical protein
VSAADEVVVSVVDTEPEAQIVIGLLQANGIECYYRDTEQIDSPLEDFTAAGRREIVVHAADADAARELVAADPADPSE